MGAGKIIDRVTGHFDAVGLRQIEVPEWGDEAGPLIIYAEPMTLAEKTAVNKAVEASGKGAHALFVEVLVLKARDEHGEPMFDKGDKPVLRTRADAAVVERIALKIMAAATVEDQEKN